IQLALFASVFGAWYFATRTGPRTLLLPPPDLVWREMQALWFSGRLGAAALITVAEILQAYAIAATAGILVGFLVTRSRTLARIGFFIWIASVLGGETLAAVAGVGKSIALAAELMETARLYAWIAFVVIVSVMLNLIALAAESRSERE